MDQVAQCRQVQDVDRGHVEPAVRNPLPGSMRGVAA
jgi:hypothetical protein